MRGVAGFNVWKNYRTEKELNPKNMPTVITKTSYRSLLIIQLPILHTTLILKWGGVLYLNIWLVSTIRPHKRMDTAKLHGSSYLGEQQQCCWSLLVLLEEWQGDNMHCGWLRRRVSTSSRGNENANYFIYQAKSFNRLYSQTTLRNSYTVYSVHITIV